MLAKIMKEPIIKATIFLHHSFYLEPELNNVALRLNSLFLDNISFADLITMRKETCQEDELARAVRQQSQGTFFQFATIVSVILILPNISGMR
jgi:uncharacterized protein involved in cysteine biosynthesis